MKVSFPTRLHAGFLNGGVLAILFPVLDIYTLPFEVVILFYLLFVLTVFSPFFGLVTWYRTVQIQHLYTTRLSSINMIIVSSLEVVLSKQLWQTFKVFFCKYIFEIFVLFSLLKFF